MSATVHEIPMAPLLTHRIYEPRLLGKRARHRHYDAYGRLSGDVRVDRGCVWVEAETNEGRFWWAETSVELLGPVAMPQPCPRGGR